MHIIDHPADFKCGTRLLLLKGRYKDGVTIQRSITRVTHSSMAFDTALIELRELARQGERIYASAGARSMHKAIHEFKRRQLDADCSGDAEFFYKTLSQQFESALRQEVSQEQKLWLFDCDTAEDTALAEEALRLYYRDEFTPYRYATKTGTHFIVRPFNRANLSDNAKALVHTNPLMLWAYWL